MTAQYPTPEPNFFIIGAPKCGTTALSSYLEQHPNVLFSHPKEPHFFNDDFSFRPTTDWSDYLACFSHGRGDEVAVGEGSVFYLYSKRAVPNILSRYPAAKFIVMLRNPVEASHSCHAQTVYLNGEYLSFAEAWQAQEMRSRGTLRVPDKNFAELFQYRALYSYSEQLARLTGLVGGDRLRVILYDDFARDTPTVHREVLDFLELEQRPLDSYPKVNSSKSPRSRALERAWFHLAAAKRKAGISRGLGVLTKVKSWNTAQVERPPIDPDLRTAILDCFRADITATSALIGRDLSHWLAGE